MPRTYVDLSAANGLDRQPVPSPRYPQLNNHWMESLDYRYHRIHVNSKTAVTEADGSIRIVVAHEDPGHPNWIRTAGHRHGTMCFRWVRPVGEAPEPGCRVVRVGPR